MHARFESQFSLSPKGDDDLDDEVENVGDDDLEDDDLEDDDLEDDEDADEDDFDEEFEDKLIDLDDEYDGVGDDDDAHRPPKKPYEG